MYRVTMINNDERTVIHHEKTNELKLESGTIKTKNNKIASFNFSFYPNNPGFNQIRPYQTFIEVLNTKTRALEFEGRVLTPSENMGDDGILNYSYLCEGELGYLHDSQQRHMEFRGTPRELLKSILDYHNSQVEDYKRFELGEMNVTNSTDNLYLYLSAEEDTFEAINDKLIDRLGGELRIRKVDGVRLLDYLEIAGERKQTEIRIAKNLKSISVDKDPTDIVTRLTPLGERIESEDEDDTDASEARLTIESVNNGVPYIDRLDLIAEFGMKGGSQTWDDITLPENLLTTGQNWLNNQKVSLNQYTLTAYDLSLIGLDIDYFETGNYHPVINPVMGIDESLRIVGKSTDITNPENASLTIGDKFKTLKEYQRDANRTTGKVVELENTVSRQSERLANIRQEMNNVDNILEDINENIGDADIPALEESINNLNAAVSDLIDAVDAIPDYDPATEDADGLMASADKAKLNLVTVTQPTNLDDLLQEFDDLNRRVEALENEGNES